jgi:hypothetical protein
LEEHLGHEGALSGVEISPLHLQTVNFVHRPIFWEKSQENCWFNQQPEHVSHPNKTIPNPSHGACVRLQERTQDPAKHGTGACHTDPQTS